MQKAPAREAKSISSPFRRKEMLRRHKQAAVEDRRDLDPEMNNFEWSVISKEEHCSAINTRPSLALSTWPFRRRKATHEGALKEFILSSTSAEAVTGIEIQLRRSVKNYHATSTAN